MNKVVIVETDLSNSKKTLPALNHELKHIIEKHNEDGYKVVTVTPLTEGHYDYQEDDNKSYGYGYSYTTGIVVVFEKVNQ